MFSQKDYTYNTRIIAELQTRMKRFEEFISLTSYLYGDSGIRRDLLANSKMKIETEADGLSALEFALPLLESADYSSLDSLKSGILEAIATAGKKN